MEQQSLEGKDLLLLDFVRYILINYVLVLNFNSQKQLQLLPILRFGRTPHWQKKFIACVYITIFQ